MSVIYRFVYKKIPKSTNKNCKHKMRATKQGEE